MYSEFRIRYHEVDINGNKYCVPRYAETRPAAQHVLHKKTYEENTHRLMKYVLEYTQKSAVHAGTFFGDMIPNFSEFCGGTLYAFEPVLENYVMAKQCIDKNDISNVVIFNSALSDRQGSARFKTISEEGYHMGGWSHITNAETDPNRSQVVTTLRIDDIYMNDLAVIHLDLEGHEKEALYGAVNTIRKDEPILILEAGPKDLSALDGMGYEQMFEGYHIDVYATNKHKYLTQAALKTLP